MTLLLSICSFSLPTMAAATKKTTKKDTKDINNPSPKKKKDVKEAQPAPSIRIRISAFDHTVLDEAVGKIIETSERSGAIVHGPIPLPTKTKKFTVLKSTFKHKDSRDQYEMRIHRRLIDLKETTFKTMDSLQNLSLPAGVDVEIKMS